MKKYLKLGKKLFPICRSLTGSGTLKTLKILKKELPELKIKRIKSGTKVYDWEIPDEWNVKDAYVVDKNQKKIINFKRNNLHLVGYSTPQKKIVSKKVLLEHLHTIKKLPNAIPYVTSYYKKYWGFCLKYSEKKRIIREYSKYDKFKINIKTNFNKNGYMNYGEAVIKGNSKKEVLISTYICHPSMANNELSGPLVTLALAKFFQKRKLEKTIRILFIPETIGSIAYIKKNLSRLRKNIIGGFTLTCIGDEKKYSYLSTKYGNAPSDFAAKKAFKELGIKYKKYSFLDRGSDERQYNSVGVDLNIGSIMRSKYGTYKEYHTSLDNFKVMTARGLKGGYEVSKKSILNLLIDNYKFPKKKIVNKKYPLCSIKCEPKLGKKNLYPHLSNRNIGVSYPRKILDFLQFADGTNSIKKISKNIRCSKKMTNKIYKIVKKNKFLKK